MSLIFWSLLIVVTLKYVVLIMQADNDGEGGILALSALAHRTPGLSRRAKLAMTTIAILGLALFFGDGMLTPAISVLSAVEGLSVESPAFAPLVMPLSLVILIGLFLLQSRGTALRRRPVRPGDGGVVHHAGGARSFVDRQGARRFWQRSIRLTAWRCSCMSRGRRSFRLARWCWP